MSKLYTLVKEQFLPAPLEKIWDFISAPSNLKIITPPELKLVLSREPQQRIYPGMIISYTVEPLLRLRFEWVTEITQVEDLKYFIDEQRFGPYTFWHHQHFLEQEENGVRMKDIVSYKVPGGPLGDLINRWIVKKKLEEIFEYRFNRLESIYSKKG